MQLAENKHIKSQLKLKDQFKLSPAFDETITEEEVDQGVQSTKILLIHIVPQLCDSKSWFS